VNQQANTLSLIQTGEHTGIIVCREVCDPCEASLYYEGPNGSLLSDFVLPGWWVPNYPFQVDFLGLIEGPLRVATGGYIEYQVVTLSGPQRASADTAELDMEAAAEAMRDEMAAAFGSRLGAVRELQARHRLEPPGTSAEEATVATSRAASPIPQRLLHPAALAPDVRVVGRHDVFRGRRSGSGRAARMHVAGCAGSAPPVLGGGGGQR
jgi:hypothetical protein